MNAPSKRFRIIELGKSGMTKSAIVEQLVKEGYDNVSYQYVYNTLKEKQIVVPASASSTVSKSKRIKELAATGMSKSEIVKTMVAEGIQVDYHYVFMITKYHMKKVVETIIPGAEVTEVVKPKRERKPKVQLETAE